MVQRDELVARLDSLLECGRFKDYGPNGLQVEGRATVRKLASGVTASLATVEAAIEAGADALLVHHGLFWRGQDGRVTGWMRQRLGRLIEANLNLLAYHLPLDAHPTLGNNAALGARLGVTADAWFGDQGLGFMGPAPDASLQALVARADAALNHPGWRGVTVVAGDGRPLKRLAWCTGGAQGYFEAAIAAGADAYLTGEISEPQAHYARETGVAYLACGHHATERFGAPSVAAHMASALGLEHVFIDQPNPA
jgi:dinuclear metal center YbgI/SA1388 family protein